MARINLSMDDALLETIKKVAAETGTSANLLIINILEESFQGEKTFDYVAALHKLIDDVGNYPEGEFTLSELPSFSRLCVSTAEKGYIQPSTLRARLGKAFNKAVSQGQVPGVIRAMVEKNGKKELKFVASTAVYEKKANGNRWEDKK